MLVDILRPGATEIEQIDDSFLVKTVEVVDNDREYTVVTIYHLKGDPINHVHRSVHVTLKDPQVTAVGAIWNFVKSIFTPKAVPTP